eukprot:COSAG02_NODE_5804_length_4024_cov_5.645860_4_plen_45_part_00
MLRGTVGIERFIYVLLVVATVWSMFEALRLPVTLPSECVVVIVK